MRHERHEKLGLEPGTHPDWDAKPATDGSGPADNSLVLAQLEELLASVQASPESHPEWEAACLMSVADMLESLDKARTGWDSISARMTEARARIEETRARESAIRQDLRETSRLLEETKEDLQEARRDLGKVGKLEEQLQRMRGELDAAKNRVLESDRLDDERQAAVERSETLQSELDEMRWQVAELTHERDEAAKEIESLRGAREELSKERDDAVSARQGAAATRDALVSERDGLQARIAELEEAARAAEAADAQAEALRGELENLQKDHQQDLVALCDLRVIVNRLEKERDEAVKERRRKVKKILAKVHMELDSAGAPSGDEMSYGERIRHLVEKLGGSTDGERFTLD